eukprot:1191582-Prorocentrum_minimum.AAC.1
MLRATGWMLRRSYLEDRYLSGRMAPTVTGDGAIFGNPCDWLPHQEYALFPPVIGSHRQRYSGIPTCPIPLAGSRAGPARVDRRMNVPVGDVDGARGPVGAPQLADAHPERDQALVDHGALLQQHLGNV